MHACIHTTTDTNRYTARAYVCMHVSIHACLFVRVCIRMYETDPCTCASADTQVYRAGSAGKNLNKQGGGSRTYYDPLTGKPIYPYLYLYLYLYLHLYL